MDGEDNAVNQEAPATESEQSPSEPGAHGRATGQASLELSDAPGVFRLDEELRSCLPPLAAHVRQQLEADIVAHGCREPLATWSGILWDGYERFEICRDHQIPYSVYELPFSNIEEAVAARRRSHVNRRHLSEVQRAYLAWLESKSEAPQSRQQTARSGGRAGGRGRPRKSSEVTGASEQTGRPRRERIRPRLAAEYRVKENLIKKVRKIAEVRPDLGKALYSGALDIQQAERQIREAAAKSNSGGMDAPVRTHDHDDEIVILAGDMKLLEARVADGTAMLVVADAPSSETDVSTWYAAAAELAAAKLVPGGLFLAVTDILRLHLVMETIKAPLQWHCELIIDLAEQQPAWDIKVRITHRSILMFTKEGGGRATAG